MIKARTKNQFPIISVLFYFNEIRLLIGNLKILKNKLVFIETTRCYLTGVYYLLIVNCLYPSLFLK